MNTYRFLHRDSYIIQVIPVHSQVIKSAYATWPIHIKCLKIVLTRISCRSGASREKAPIAACAAPTVYNLQITVRIIIRRLKMRLGEIGQLARKPLESISIDNIQTKLLVSHADLTVRNATEIKLVHIVPQCSIDA